MSSCICRRFYFTSCLAYKWLNNSAPSYLSKRVTYINGSHKYSTRAAVNNDLLHPQPFKEIFKHSITFQGYKIWNSLPSNIRLCNNFPAFKEIFKARYLVSN